VRSNLNHVMGNISRIRSEDRKDADEEDLFAETLSVLEESLEGVDRIGNIMIDSFVMLKDKIAASNARDEFGLSQGEYALVTLHRPSNVDAPETLGPIVAELIEASEKLPVVFVAHPRTIKSLEVFGLREKFESAAGVTLLEPLPYIQFMNVVTGSRMVITDSGGLQEETTYLDIPCLTLRENTERPITINQGTNKLVTADSLAANIDDALNANWPKGICPDLWDGETATRAVECLRIREQNRS
jgi:UDP-N-acetylglucosamine 2-epimerase (non-hydrolysing)